jgi:hypothetical protein
MNTPGRREPVREAPADRRRQSVAGMLGVNLALPFALYYGLRLAGADP